MAEDLTEGHADEPEEGTRLEGWHADPFGRFAHRWWDGESWTASVVPSTGGSRVQWDPAPLPAALATAAPPAPGLPSIVTALVGMVVGIALSAVVSIVIGRMDEPPSLAAELLLSSVALWIGLLGAVVVVSRRRGTGSIVRDYGLRFRWSDLGFGVAGALVGRIIAGASLLPLPLLDRDFGETNDRTLLDDAASDGWSWVALIVVACVGAPIVEELFFRGLLQNRLVERYGLGVALPIASVLFGAAHLIGWDGFPTVVNAWAVTFGGGLVLGAVYHYAKRLGPAIIAHSLFNAVALVLLWVLRT